MLWQVLPSLEQVGRLPFEYGISIVLVFSAAYVIHWLRRAFREPVRSKPAHTLESADVKVEVYDPLERMYHWALTIVLGLIVLTGVAFYLAGALSPLLGAFGATNTFGLLFWHVELAWPLLALIVIHSIWDPVIRRLWHNITVGRHDIKEATTRVKNFLGKTKEYPPGGKYDIFMKSFHWGTVLSLVFLGVSGLFFWNPFGLFPTLSPQTELVLRWLHDIFGFVFLGLAIGHVYFALLPKNWPLLKSMITGKMDKDVFDREFDAERWPVASEARNRSLLARRLGLAPKQKAPKEKAKDGRGD